MKYLNVNLKTFIIIYDEHLNHNILPGIVAVARTVPVQTVKREKDVFVMYSQGVPPEDRKQAKAMIQDLGYEVRCELYGSALGIDSWEGNMDKRMSIFFAHIDQLKGSSDSFIDWFYENVIGPIPKQDIMTTIRDIAFFLTSEGLTLSEAVQTIKTADAAGYIP